MAKKAGGFLAEFKAFALKGNVMDLAVGVIIGGAFSSITNSLIGDIIMPLIGMFLGGVDFSSWAIQLPNLFANGDPVMLNLGMFIQTVINFLILALVVFLLVKVMNKMRRAKEEAPPPPPPEPAPSAEEILLTEIRDLLKEKQNG